MIAEILPGQLLLGGVANLLDFPETLVSRLAIVQCISSFEVQMYLNRSNYWANHIKPTLARNIDETQNSEHPSFTESLEENILQVNIDDHPTASIESYFEQAADFIDHKIKKCGKVVLVHCAAGVSRSSSVVLAYLMIKQKMTLEEAIVLTKTHRLVMNPNVGFLDALLQLEARLFGSNELINGNSSAVVFSEPREVAHFIEHVVASRIGSTNQQHYKTLLESGARYSKSLRQEIETQLADKNNDEVDKNFEAIYQKIVEKQFGGISNMVVIFEDGNANNNNSINGNELASDNAFADDEKWCPPPVQVGIDEYFQLSKIDAKEIEKVIHRQDRRASTADETIAKYREMVAHAEMEISAANSEKDRRTRENEMEDWEKELMKDVDENSHDGNDE